MERAPKVCSVCLREFVPPYGYKTKHWTMARFCSAKCNGFGRSIGAKKVCAQCKKEFYVKASASEKVKFCSKRCYTVRQRESLLGENNPNFKDGHQSRLRKIAGRGKGNRLYRKGKRGERKAKEILNQQGYYVISSAASKGVWDLVAVGVNVKLIQVKVNKPPSLQEYQAMLQFSAPENVIKELWVFIDWNTTPQISVIPNS